MSTDAWQTIKIALEHEDSSDLSVMMTDVRFHTLMSKIHTSAGRAAKVPMDFPCHIPYHALMF